MPNNPIHQISDEFEANKVYANSIGMNKEGAVCPNGFSSLWEVFDRQPESNRLLGVSFPDPTLRTQCIGKLLHVQHIHFELCNLNVAYDASLRY